MTHWVITNDQGQFLMVDDQGQFLWTSDRRWGLRFAREQDAEMLRRADKGLGAIGEARKITKASA